MGRLWRGRERRATQPEAWQRQTGAKVSENHYCMENKDKEGRSGRRGELGGGDTAHDHSSLEPGLTGDRWEPIAEDETTHTVASALFYCPGGQGQFQQLLSNLLTVSGLIPLCRIMSSHLMWPHQDAVAWSSALTLAQWSSLRRSCLGISSPSEVLKRPLEHSRMLSFLATIYPILQI